MLSLIKADDAIGGVGELDSLGEDTVLMVVVAVVTLASADSIFDESILMLVASELGATEDMSKWLTCKTSRFTSLFLPRN